MSWLDFANHFLSNQRLRARSWINRTFFGNSVFGGKFGSECFGLFLFYFCLVRGEKVVGAQDFWLAIKGRGPLQVVVSFLFCLWQFCIVQILSGLKTFLYISFVFFRSSIENFSFSFVFFRSLTGNFSLSFVFFRSLIENFFVLEAC